MLEKLNDFEMFGAHIIPRNALVVFVFIIVGFTSAFYI